MGSVVFFEIVVNVAVAGLAQLLVLFGEQPLAQLQT